MAEDDVKNTKGILKCSAIKQQFILNLELIKLFFYLDSPARFKISSKLTFNILNDDIACCISIKLKLNLLDELWHIE